MAEADEQALPIAPQTILREDPSLRIRQRAQSGQTILSGTGESQFDVMACNSGMQRMPERGPA